MQNDLSKKVNCLIIDDEEMATKVIEAHLSHIPDFEVVGIYHSAVEAFLALDTLQVEVLFLDIQMPKITGIGMLKMLQQKPLTVLTTAHREFALEGFELEVVDYLLKPIGFQRFLQTISRLKKQLFLSQPEVSPSVSSSESKNLTVSPSKHIFIKTNRAYQKIDFDAILHIEAIKNHIKIVTTAGTNISLIGLSEFARQLPQQFLRVHRSFIVNQHNISKFDNHFITIGNQTIPIGRSYKDAALEELRKLVA